jgi:hypothetical protein
LSGGEPIARRRHGQAGAPRIRVPLVAQHSAAMTAYALLGGASLCLVPWLVLVQVIFFG